MNKSSSGMPKEHEEHVLEHAKQAITHVATDVKQQAENQVNTGFDERKEKALETMGDVASALRDTGDKLKGVGPLGSVASRAADRVDSLAHYFENKSMADVAHEVERFARREPALFLGAAFAIGLVGGRFLKSSSRRDSESTEDEPYLRDTGRYGEYRAQGTRDYRGERSPLASSTPMPRAPRMQTSSPSFGSETSRTGYDKPSTGSAGYDKYATSGTGYDKPSTGSAGVQSSTSTGPGGTLPGTGATLPGTGGTSAGTGSTGSGSIGSTGTTPRNGNMGRP